MWEAIRANKRRSVMLILVVAMILLSLGCVIGLYIRADVRGGAVVPRARAA